MITTCIFDLDGTLVDSLEDLADSTNYLLEQYLYPTHSIESYRAFVGNGLAKLLIRAFPKGKSNDIQTIKDQFLEIYQQRCLNKTKAYSGMLEVIEKLSATMTLAVVTNKPDGVAKNIVSSIFDQSFSYVYGNKDGDPHKPDPYFVEKVIQQTKANKEEVIYIGDSDVDILTGQNAGVKTIGVAWGFRGETELIQAGATKVVASPKELGELIDAWNQ